MGGHIFTGFPLEFTPYLIRGRNDKGDMASIFITMTSQGKNATNVLDESKIWVVSISML